MHTSFTTVSLPRNIGQMIRKIAKAEHKTVVELISGWTKDTVAQFGWDQDFSPICGAIEWDGTEIIIRTTFFGECRRDFTPTQARSLAASISDLVDRGGAPQSVDDVQINPDAAGRYGRVVVTRKGSGIIIELNDYRCSMSTDVARGIALTLEDLAREAHDSQCALN